LKFLFLIVLFFLLAIQWNIINAQNITTENMITNEIVMNTSTTIISTTTTTTTTKDHNNMNINHPPLSTLLCEKRVKPYFLPHTYEISQFYVCVKGQLFLLNCPSGYRFDSKADQCIRKTIKDEIKESKLFFFVFK